MTTKFFKFELILNKNLFTGNTIPQTLKSGSYGKCLELHNSITSYKKRLLRGPRRKYFQKKLVESYPKLLWLQFILGLSINAVVDKSKRQYELHVKWMTKVV